MIQMPDAGGDILTEPTITFVMTTKYLSKTVLGVTGTKITEYKSWGKQLLVNISSDFSTHRKCSNLEINLDVSFRHDHAYPDILVDISFTLDKS